MNDLPWAHGGPALQAKIRSQPEDFAVTEVLGFTANGAGQHLLLTVRKRNTNTAWLADQLAAYAGVKSVAVGYAGAKDRYAVTTQSFSVNLAGKPEPDWSEFPHKKDVEILSAARHNRKLKRGALQANRFTLTLRDCVGHFASAEQRLSQIAAHGVPNYFGEQRFGRGGSNVARAEALFSGRRVDRKTRSMLISAARSQIFNAVLAARVEAGTWNQAMPGEIFSLNGSRSWFAPKSEDANLVERMQNADIHPSGPLWGQGAPPSSLDLLELETRVAAEYGTLTQGLKAVGLEQDRRALRLIPTEMSWEWLDSKALQLDFSLPAGSYATVVLRELAHWN